MSLRAFDCDALVDYVKAHARTAYQITPEPHNTIYQWTLDTVVVTQSITNDNLLLWTEINIPPHNQATLKYDNIWCERHPQVLDLAHQLLNVPTTVALDTKYTTVNNATHTIR